MSVVKAPKRPGAKKAAKTKAPCPKCGGDDHSRSECFLKKGSRVEVLYDDTWYKAEIVLCHRKDQGYKVKYDEDGMFSSNIPSENIRKIQV